MELVGKCTENIQTYKLKFKYKNKYKYTSTVKSDGVCWEVYLGLSNENKITNMNMNTNTTIVRHKYTILL